MYKKLLITLTGIFFAVVLKGQSELTLDSCINLMLKNHPQAKQTNLYKKAGANKAENISSNYFPVLSLNGKATYQSQTLSFDIEMPSLPGFELNIPSPPLDQYSVYIEAKQLIWDGGITKSLVTTENLNTLADIKQNEVELLKLEDQTENVYFLIMFFYETEKQLNVVRNDLISKRKSIVSAIENGILTPDNYDMIDAEILKIEQKIAGTRESRTAQIKILSRLTNTEFGDTLILAEPNLPEIKEFDDTNGRPEKELLEIKGLILNSNIVTLNKKRMPQIFAFAQAGYGNPGLAMINDDWSAYFIAGATLSWTIWDKNNTKRSKEILLTNSQIIENQIEIFDENISIAAQNLYSEIMKLQQYIEKDKKIIALRDNIIKKAEVKLENGTITSSEYISFLNEKNNAVIEYQIHKTQLLKAKKQYLGILNK